MRNTKTLTIQEDKKPAYRDNGKVFVITEMPADQGIRWADRLLFAITNQGIELPDGVIGGGMAGLAAVGVGALLNALGRVKFEDAEPLLDEMMACVQYRHAQGQPLQAIAHGANCQIEEVQTFWTLRIAWFELHLGFSFADAAQKLKTAASAEPASPST
jgi:hypothetical protein